MLQLLQPVYQFITEVPKITPLQILLEAMCIVKVATLEEGGGRGGGGKLEICIEHLQAGGWRWKIVIHLFDTRRQFLQVPGMSLDVLHCEALGGIWHQYLPEQVPALSAHTHVRRELVLNPQDALQSHKQHISWGRTL